jgi:C1A family cysteine protease
MRVAILLSLVALTLAVNSDLVLRRKFSEFQTKYARNYATQDEREHRFRIFSDNMKKSADLEKVNPNAKFGMNKFSDLSHEEFASKYLMNVDFSNYVAPPPHDLTLVKPNVQGCQPDKTNYDWFAQCGACTPIYNQGQCGSCWAFSATETIESYFFLATGTLEGLSMEQIVSCDTAGEDQGCGGGFPTGAYTYVEGAGGIEDYNDYPYIAEGGEAGSCNFNSGDIVATVTSYNSINGETGLYQQMVSASGGPVSVCVDASSWQNYEGGVLSTCGNDVDHCVQATGYANYGESGAYWIVRNSWGTDWGLAGFINIEIGQDLCSIGDYATVVTATKA